MKAPTQIKKPENWQDFELLCKKLWGEIWGCSDTIKKNGRSGQKQDGVDIYGVPKGENHYYGIQCKGKSDYSNSILTKNEIDSEIEKAKEFKPHLKRFIIATTSSKDVEIEEYVRERDIINRELGLFEVHLACWEDIVDLLKENRQTFQWYINDCQYKDNTDVEITFAGANEIIIYPQYIKEITIYRKKQNTDNARRRELDNIFWRPPQLPRLEPILVPDIDILHPKHNVDYRWCTIPIKIENTGNTTIKDYKLYFFLDGNSIEELSCGIHYANNIFLGEVTRAAINRQIDEDRELFDSSENDNELIFIPKDSTLVQTDRRLFNFKVKPKDGCTEITFHWDFKSQDFSKSGILKIVVEPQYEEKYIFVDVDDEELSDPHVEIFPKIVKE